MGKFSFVIDEKAYDVDIKDSPSFNFGKEEILSTPESDIAFNQSWYNQGFQTFKFLDDTEFGDLVNGLNSSIKKIIESELGATVENFDLSKYHHVVKTDEDHFKVVSKTRDLFPDDFNFPILSILDKFEQFLGFKLVDINPKDGAKVHIIVRINRPFSTDFNPPHKDIYEAVDIGGYIPQFINLWIPICGVTEKSSLPLANSSHLLPESDIFRTFDGGVVEGKKYRVRVIKEWGGSNKLSRAKVDYGEVLFFTSHLVHGLAINEEPDTTRVALEFRLFKAE